jgi:hypothetical protein
MARRRPNFKRAEAVLSYAVCRAGKEERTVTRDAKIGPFERRNMMAQMLGDIVALLAMQQRRAPLPVSSALRNAILRGGLPNGLIELGDFARRYLFLGDERMLLAELQRRPRCAEVISEELPGHSGIATE